MKKKFTYKDSGVDIDSASEVKKRIAKLAKSTFSPFVLSEIGSFGGIFQPDLKRFNQPVFVSSVDGVGTKLKLSILCGKYDTVGIDLVCHCVNDILVHGALPVFFLDYIASSKLEPSMVEELVKGISKGCRENECALIGGETAELPGVYNEREYDLVGFIVGITNKANIIDGKTISVGDKLIGLASSSLHTNGYSLARKVLLEVKKYPLDSQPGDLNCSLIEELMKPHLSYLKVIKNLLGTVRLKGVAHITGGGMPGNIPRVFPPNIGAIIKKESWIVPPIFTLIRGSGNIDEDEMYRTFNMGIGMIVCVPPSDVDKTISLVKEQGVTPYLIGETVKDPDKSIKIVH